MSFSRIIQIIGMVTALDSLYFGIVKESMKMEMLLLFIGGVVFYLGRSLERRTK